VTAEYLFAPVMFGALVSGALSVADTMPTHRIPSALALEAASETLSACAKQGFHETAVVVDADGTTIVTLRGDGAGRMSAAALLWIDCSCVLECLQNIIRTLDLTTDDVELIC